MSDRIRWCLTHRHESSGTRCYAQTSLSTCVITNAAVVWAGEPRLTRTEWEDTIEDALVAEYQRGWDDGHTGMIPTPNVVGEEGEGE